MIFFKIPFILLLFLTSTDSTQSKTTNMDHFNPMSTIEIDGFKMAYIDQGQGPVILMIHGIPTSSFLYRKMVDPLVKKGYRVVVPDMLGFGNSDKPQDLTLYDAVDHGERLSQFTNKLGIDKFNLVVHDAGGPWSWTMVANHPERISRLIVLNTILYTEGFKPPISAKKGSFMNRVIGMLYKSLSKSMVKSTLKSGTEMHDYSKEEFNAYADPIKNGGHIAVRGFFGDIPSYEKLAISARKTIIEHDIPVKLIWGEKDKFLVGQTQIPLAMKELNIKSENVHFLARCKHFIQEEVPVQICDYIAKFVK